MRRLAAKGIVGIETAIVLIAFVIVAAALAFVALNMGMFTTQKSKETIGRGLGEASSALEVDGGVTAYVDAASGKVIGVIIPLKVSPGREAVDFRPDKLTVRLVAKNQAFEEIYSGVAVVNDFSVSSLISVVNLTDGVPDAKIVFIKNDGDEVLEYGEKALLIVDLGAELVAYDTFKVEVKSAQGAPLTIERMIPPTIPITADSAFDLG